MNLYVEKTLNVFKKIWPYLLAVVTAGLYIFLRSKDDAKEADKKIQPVLDQNKLINEQKENEVKDAAKVAEDLKKVNSDLEKIVEEGEERQKDQSNKPLKDRVDDWNNDL